jgi:hypothetical protein
VERLPTKVVEKGRQEYRQMLAEAEVSGRVRGAPADRPGTAGTGVKPLFLLHRRLLLGSGCAVVPGRPAPSFFSRPPAPPTFSAVNSIPATDPRIMWEASGAQLARPLGRRAFSLPA